MSTSTGVFQSDITSLSPEILLKIFLNLESHETVILRSVCREFFEIIDNNKSLWRILDWVQEKCGSAVRALENFDEKSGSTLRQVSVFQRNGELDGENLVKVLDRSRNTLTNLSLKFCSPGVNFLPRLIELASNSHFLNTLVHWFSQEIWLSRLPKTRLTRSSRQPYLGTKRSRNLQVLWCLYLVNTWDGKLDVSSLVSFADTIYYRSLELRSFISSFEKTLIHLSMNSSKGIDTPSLSCPSLRILEGHFSFGLPSWLDAPNLQIIIARDIDPRSFRQLPISVEELWLLGWYYSQVTTASRLGFLSSVCPQLRIVKLGKELFEGDFDTRCLLKSIRAREKKAREGVEIEGIKMRSLEKLIVPTELLEPAQLAALREIVNEVIDIKDYPDFIGLEY